MQTNPPDSWSAPVPTYEPVEAGYLPDMATPPPTVMACDPIGPRHQLINHVVSECGARAHWVNDSLAIQPIDPSRLSNLAVVGLGPCPKGTGPEQGGGRDHRQGTGVAAHREGQDPRARPTSLARLCPFRRHNTAHL
jgi:hypothetical protein